MGQAPELEEVIAILKAHEAFYRAKGVTRMAVFGSVARGDAGPDSDVDLVIDLDPNAKFSLIDLGLVEDASTEWLDRKADMLARRALRPRIALQVQADAVDVF